MACALQPRLGVSVRLIVIIVIGLLSGVLAAAASPEESAHDDAAGAAVQKVDDATLERLRRLHYTELAEVHLVLLPASVVDRRGRVIRDLEQHDFRVYEDGMMQRIRYFSTGTSEPISVAFLLDVSGSMRQLDKLHHAKEAVRYLVEGMGPQDRFGLICFADEQVVWVTDLTSDRERFLRRLDVQEGFGQTALNDAVAAAPELVDGRVQGRKAIVLITDGVDNFSQLDADAAVALARRVNVPIYTIGFLSVPPAMLPKATVGARLETLGKFSEETGGWIYPVYDPAELKEAVAALDSELRYQYLIGYHPAVRVSPGDGGTFRRVRLEVAQRRATVRTRSGYFAVP